MLVHGASGSLGVFAVQLAKHSGAHVTAVCGRRSEADRPRLPLGVIDAGTLRTVIGGRYTLDEIADAPAGLI